MPVLRSSVLAVATTALALLASACGTQPSSPTPVAAVATPPVAPDRPSDPVVALAGRTSPEQAGALLDGRVTRDEYRAASRAARQCFVRRGLPVRVDPLAAAPGGELSYGWRVRAASKEQLARRERQAMAASDACEARFRSAIAVVHANQRVVPAAERPARMDRLRACLRRAGADVDPGDSIAELARTVARGTAAQAACLDADLDLLRRTAPLPAG